MSYFGTDQSQVQRYLSGRSITESRLGLLFNGLFKVPMQFLILFVGVMVFVFHQFQPAADVLQPARRSTRPTARRAPASSRALEDAQAALFTRKQAALARLEAALDRHDAAAEHAAADSVRAAENQMPDRAQPGASWSSHRLVPRDRATTPTTSSSRS